MVVENIYNLLISGLNWLLSLMPDVTWSVDTGVFSYFISIINTIKYLLPMEYIADMFDVIIGFMTFRIIIALLRTVWDILPIV